MRVIIAYSKIKKKKAKSSVDNATYQRETLSERPIRLPLRHSLLTHSTTLKAQFINR